VIDGNPTTLPQSQARSRHVEFGKLNLLLRVLASLLLYFNNGVLPLNAPVSLFLVRLADTKDLSVFRVETHADARVVEELPHC
jgi:hypothetical protein